MKASKSPHKQKERRRFVIEGAVQGVGFRPFIYRLAHEMKLAGWVNNTPQGVVIEVEGDGAEIDLFHNRIKKEKPINAVIDQVTAMPVPPEGETSFRIAPSTAQENVSASILPDLAICPECLAEMNNPSDRRFRYPFINCTHCGPRWSIIRKLPYDRPHTTMSGFDMCAACRTEYDNPMDRRFHAQPIACPDCGPQVELQDGQGNVLFKQNDAIQAAADALRAGKIIALKGLGGFHLIADARNNEAIKHLRVLKHRPAKPFAVMYPSMETLRQDCIVTEAEAALLRSPQSPIVLLQKKNSLSVTPEVAPGNPYLGVMLPYTPLHVLLLQELRFPVVATSGNRVSEPICINEQEALERLEGIADLFLMHNRPIARRADDSIVRIMAGREMALRRARGYAPLPILVKQQAKKSYLAAGGYLKNTVAIVIDNRLMISPHIGDLDTAEACAAHQQALDDLIGLYQMKPDAIACDAHPDYASTRMAHTRGGTVIPVQHHYAHALSCMADNGFDEPALAVVWDGTGYGDDGTIWGGEFLKMTKTGYQREFHFRTFPLPGGEKAIREPRRSALGILYSLERKYNDLSFSSEERKILAEALQKGLNCPLTSSAGRLFDAVAALTGLCTISSFEGEAAMALEFAASATTPAKPYSFKISEGAVDWRPLIHDILSDMEQNISVSMIASRFHETLAEIIVAVARLAEEKNVLLTGGCFQNKLLLERAIEKLAGAGFQPFWHRQIPPNDGGIAAGQIMAAIRRE